MIRSLLYVPAISERFIARAHERGADAIILDLEDSVAPSDKDTARRALAQAVPAVGRNGARVMVRINADPALQFEDAVAAVRAGADGLIVPKAETAAALVALAEGLEPVEHEVGHAPIPFAALLETPGAVLDARAIARAPRIFAMLTGGEDLATTMGATPDPEFLHFPKLLVHYAAKAENLFSFGLLRSIAGYSDHDAIRAAASEAKRFGFDGATCVHPSVVPLLNDGFSPSETERAWAREVVTAAQGHAGSAFALDGRMIDAPVIARARRILDIQS
jgi:citrate lyase subunit beta/citryl-CoA lyase